MKKIIQLLLITLFFSACTKEKNDSLIDSQADEVAKSQQDYSIIGKWDLAKIEGGYCAQSCMRQSFIQWNADFTTIGNGCCDFLKGGGCTPNQFCAQREGNWRKDGDTYTFTDKFTKENINEKIVFTTDSTLYLFSEKSKKHFYFKKEAL